MTNFFSKSAVRRAGIFEIAAILLAAGLVFTACKHDVTTYTVTFMTNFPQNSGDSTVYRAVQCTEKASLGGNMPGALDDKNDGEYDWAFRFWDDAADGSGAEFLSTTPVTGDLKVYALWDKKDADKYRIIYHDNGGTGDIPSAYVSYKTATPALPDGKALSRYGFTFQNWNTAADGSGTTYNAGGTFTMPGKDVDLYAQWQELPKHTLFYNANGGSGSIAPVSAYETYPVTLNSGSNFTNSGFTFTGWNTNTEGSGTHYAAGASYTMPSADVTLYAQWTAVSGQTSSTITYNANGGSGKIDPKVSPEGESIELDNGAAFTKSGYKLTGWDTAADGSGVTYAVAQTIAMPSYDMTLYAQWTVADDDQCTITYINNGGMGSIPAQIVPKGQSLTLNSGSAFSRIYWNINSWNTQADGKGEVYALNSASGSINSDLVLYAHWVINQDYMKGIDLSTPVTVSSPPNYVDPYYTEYKGRGIFENCGTNGMSLTLNETFEIGVTEMTYDVWYTVYQWAINHGYKFQNAGREGSTGKDGAAPTSSAYKTPVCNVDAGTVFAWCNAFSEYEGLQPVYWKDPAYDTKGTTFIFVNSTLDQWYTGPGLWAITAKELRQNMSAVETANGFRLPTEVQWEFAARGGSPSNSAVWNYVWAGTSSYPPSSYVVYASTLYNNNSSPVKTKSPNTLGLYDMCGNIWEWVYDWYGPTPAASATNYSGPTYSNSSYAKVLKGGCYDLYIGDKKDCADYEQVRVRDLGNPQTMNTPAGGALAGGFRAARMYMGADNY